MAASGASGRRAYLAYRTAAAVACAVPEAVLMAAVKAGAPLATRVLGPRAALVARHQERARGVPLSPVERRRAASAAVASYGRYWVESFRMPVTPVGRVDRRFTMDGMEHIRSAMAAGTGPILALPHLGGWDIGGSWLVRQEIDVAAVVEALEPPELFEWFAGLRRRAGVDVIPLGPGAGSAVLKALAQARPVVLVCDRDIEGRGVEVEFFGERTTLPVGPATLALRSGAPILPAAVYFEGRGHRAVVKPALPIERTGKLRADATRLTQALAHALEDLITAAPEQWHLFQPNWPSDRT